MHVTVTTGLTTSPPPLHPPARRTLTRFCRVSILTARAMQGGVHVRAWVLLRGVRLDDSAGAEQTPGGFARELSLPLPAPVRACTLLPPALLSPRCMLVRKCMHACRGSCSEAPVRCVHARPGCVWTVCVCGRAGWHGTPLGWRGAGEPGAARLAVADAAPGQESQVRAPTDPGRGFYLWTPAPPAPTRQSALTSRRELVPHPPSRTPAGHACARPPFAWDAAVPPTADFSLLVAVAALPRFVRPPFRACVCCVHATRGGLVWTGAAAL